MEDDWDLQFHAHVHCSRGLTSKSFFEACTALTENIKPNDAKDIMTTMNHSLMNLGLLVTVPDNEDIFFAVKILEDWIEILQNLSATTCAIWPSYVVDLSLQALVVLKVSKGLKQNCEIDINEAYFIVGSIWLWSSLGFRPTISSSVIPVTSDVIGCHPDLLTDMPILFVEEGAASKSNLGGLILLKVLSMRRPSGTTRNDSKPMKIRYVASGQENSLTIAVGETLDSPDDTYDFQNNCSKIEARNEDLIENNLSCPWNIDTDLVLLETNIDDRTPEQMGFVTDLLINQIGVLDCWMTPIIMKKGRGAFTLHCLCRQENFSRILVLMFRHCTIGIRVWDRRSGFRRFALLRTIISVPVSTLGSEFDHIDNDFQVDCKVAYIGSEIISIKPEYEQCKELVSLLENEMSLQFIHDAVLREARSILEVTPTVCQTTASQPNI